MLGGAGLYRYHGCHMTTVPTHQADPPGTSNLASLMDWMQISTPMLLSFEDLSGITYDYPQLSLPERLRRHVRPFCNIAKSTIKGTHQCPLNKSMANRAAIDHGPAPLTGCCYLGLTDICQVLRYQGRDMGIFYFGSVIRKGTLEQARKRIRDICQDRSDLSAPLLRKLNKVPVVTDKQVHEAEQRLGQLVQMVTMILTGLSIPVELYDTHQTNRFAEQRSRLIHPLVLRALRIITEQHARQITLDSLGAQLRCHPVYLSRLFRKQVGKTVSDYLRQTRIDRACRLLRLGRLDITAIGMEVGFEDKSNFGRAFRQVMQMSPGEYRQQSAIT